VLLLLLLRLGTVVEWDSAEGDAAFFHIEDDQLLVVLHHTGPSLLALLLDSSHLRHLNHRGV